MPRGFLSARIDARNPRHHLWRNNGCVWWVHYTIHFDNRKRRVRRSLKTFDVRVAIARRNALFATLATEGEDVPERPPRRRRAADDERLMPLLSRDVLQPHHPYLTRNFGTMAHRRRHQ